MRRAPPQVIDTKTGEPLTKEGVNRVARGLYLI